MEYSSASFEPLELVSTKFNSFNSTQCQWLGLKVIARVDSVEPWRTLCIERLGCMQRVLFLSNSVLQQQVFVAYPARCLCTHQHMRQDWILHEHWETFLHAEILVSQLLSCTPAIPCSVSGSMSVLSWALLQRVDSVESQWGNTLEHASTRVNHTPVTNSISNIYGCAVYLQQIAQVSEIGMRGVT